MFGYIRPYKPELKMKEFEQFKACYCALCHTLGKIYGHFSRMFLSYDFVFLAMLLWPEDEKPGYIKERCIASPLCKKLCCHENGALEISAGYSVILTYWKLKDSASDERFFKATVSKFCALLLKKAYKKASEKYSDFDKSVRENLAALSEMEKNSEPSIDKTADKFALILSAAADSEDGVKARVLRQLLYHTGRWIYIADAINDLGEDLKANRYNPVVFRFSISDSIIEDDTKLSLKTTLYHSLNNIYSAYSLLPSNVWSGVLMNIIYISMPDVTEKVFTGEIEDINRIFPKNKDFRR